MGRPAAPAIDVGELFRGLSAAEVQAVMGMAEDRTYAPGACIFSLGDQQQGLYLLKRGAVEEFRLTESGDKLPMNRLGPGKLLALSSVEGRYCCFAEAIEESVIGFLSFRTLESLCRTFPKIAVNALQVLTRRLGELEERLELLAFSGLRARVAWALLTLHAAHGPRLEEVTHETLGTWATGSRPKVSVVLADLQREGLLQLSRGDIRILDPAGLERYAKQLGSDL